VTDLVEKLRAADVEAIAIECPNFDLTPAP
jgi:hypothetical protein